MRHSPRLAALALLVAGQCNAGGIELSRPLGGDDALHCDAYASQPFGEPPNSKNFQAWSRSALAFATARHSEINAKYPSGFIDLGLNGKDYRLAAKRNADLLLGGSFARRSGPTATTVDVTPQSLALVSDMHEDEESAVAVVAIFNISHGRDRMKFTGAVVCSVYELHYFYEEICKGRGAMGKQVCRWLGSSLSHSAR